MPVVTPLATCDERRAARERLGILRNQLCVAEALRREAILTARERCRAERIALHERTRALRLRLKEELREKTKAEREAAHAACRERQAAVRAADGDIERARLALRAEEALQRDLKRSGRAGEVRRKEAEKTAGLGPKGESDDAVRSKLTSEIVPLFDRVKARIKPGAHETRTEAFLRYAEQHPAEVLVAANDPAEERVRVLEEEQVRLAKEVKKKGKGTRAPKGPRRILMENLKHRDIVRRGQKIEGRRMPGQHAEIVVGESIRLFGTAPGEKTYDITFRIGDEAEYDSYNFAYTGKIVSIGEKMIGIQPDRSKRVHRLDIAYFADRNWDFDAAAIAERNARTSENI